MQTRVGAWSFGEFTAAHPWIAPAALIALTLATHAIVIAAPGFYSNDEWQKFDHVDARGWLDFTVAYTTLRPGPEFGYPLRPLGFLQQGLVARWMQSAPWVVHLASVINHAVVALVFVWVLLRADAGRTLAWLAGALFVVSPLTTIATGWIAASFDQLYIAFLLLVAAVVVRPSPLAPGPVQAAAIVLATTAALLCKETALIAPAAVAVLAYVAWLRDAARFSARFHAMAVMLASLPVALYLAYRSSAIVASATGGGVAMYTPAASNVPWNAWRLFAFPFRPNLYEMSDAVFASPWQPAAAALAHLVLVAAIARLYGTRWAVAYVAGYFVFLLPVLSIPNPGLQCMYGSALAMSLAVAAILRRLWVDHRVRAVVWVSLGVAVLLAHALTIQMRFYDTAICQTALLAAVDDTLAREGAGGRSLRIVTAQGPAARVAMRAVTARPRYEVEGRPRVVIEQFPAPADQTLPAQTDPLRKRLTSAC
ncbi:MAG: hypothetical protein ABI981_10915, partial [Betaproteobacteria bacterium]